MSRAGPQAPDIGRALLTMLRTVAGLRDRAPRPWTGSWTEPSVQPVRSGPSAARLRGSRAASAHDARGRSSHNPPVVGSSPTRPTCGGISAGPSNPPSGRRRSAHRRSRDSRRVPELTRRRPFSNDACRRLGSRRARFRSAWWCHRWPTARRAGVQRGPQLQVNSGSSGSLSADRPVPVGVGGRAVTCSPTPSVHGGGSGRVVRDERGGGGGGEGGAGRPGLT